MALGTQAKIGSWTDAQLQHSQQALPPAWHATYARINEILLESGFDEYVENLCRPFYSSGRGRPSVPPSMYFRMLLVQRLTRVRSKRELASRCREDPVLRVFLRVLPEGRTPDHSTLSVIKKRIPEDVQRSAMDFATSLLEIAESRFSFRSAQCHWG